ncbi:MAG: glycosyltransferase [Bacteroidales bacterium]
MNRKVLVSPLDWGLGHATRLIPLIQMLLKNNNQVTLAGKGRSLQMLKNAYPGLPCLEILSIKVSYPVNSRLTYLFFFLSLPRFLLSIYKDYYQLRKIIKNHEIQVVISDNRYGFYHKSLYSVLITHQLQLKFPPGLKWIQTPANWFIKRNINRFSVCWVPDHENNGGLAGELSHPVVSFKKSIYVGPLSRFSDIIISKGKHYPQLFLVGIVSGPEPQRTAFEEMIISKFISSELPGYILRGITGTSRNIKTGSVQLIENPGTVQMAQLLKHAFYVVARGGYSTIMDLYTLNCPALLVPTPGQPEQEYLSKHLCNHSLFTFISQSEFLAIENFDKWMGINREGSC